MNWVETYNGRLIRPSSVEAIWVQKHDTGKFAVIVRTHSDTPYTIGFYDVYEQAKQKQKEVYQQILESEREAGDVFERIIAAIDNLAYASGGVR